MRNLIRKYKELSFEQRTVFNTVIGLCFSTVLASGKLIIGLFTNYNLCSIAVYTFAILLSKLECILGIKTTKRTFKQRNILIAVFLFISSFFYVGFMTRMFFITRTPTEHSLVYVGLLAFISFTELGFAIAGLIRMKNKGHFYRDIKIINFAIALIAILTTQVTILDFMSTENVDIFNAYAGIGLGGFVALCAVYILIAPKISVIDREHNVFVLTDIDKNNLINMDSPTMKILLCKSNVYGSYVYQATVVDGRIDGHIIQDKSLWKRMHIILKIFCCILSEILLPVWLIGLFIFSLRSINIPQRLARKMHTNGFKKVEE